MTKNPFFRTTLQLFLIIIFINTKQQLLTEAQLFCFFIIISGNEKFRKEDNLVAFDTIFASACGGKVIEV